MVKKYVPNFGEFITEAVNVRGLSAMEPYSIKDEKKAASKFKIVRPVTIVDVEGYISDDEIDVTITFSNGDSISLEWMQRMGNGDGKVIVENSNGETEEMDYDTYVDYAGSTGTVVGDLAMVYEKMYYNEKY